MDAPSRMPDRLVSAVSPKVPFMAAPKNPQPPESAFCGVTFFGSRLTLHEWLYFSK